MALRVRVGHEHYDAPRLRAAVGRPANWWQLARFALIGASGYVVNLLVFSLARAAGADYRVAAVAAFLVAVSNNYLLNRRFTFSAHAGAAAFQAPRFLAISLLAFAVNLFVLELCVAVFGTSALLGQAIAIVAATPVNFAGNKVWTFAPSATAQRPALGRAWQARSSWLAPAAIVLLAALLRFPTLAQQSFWLDEAVTVRLLDGSLGHLLDTLPSSESTPPVYYVLAWLWTRVFGLGEFGLRSLSALAGVATVAVVYAIGARLGRRTAGVLAALLVAVHPLMVWFSQEARAYALAALFAAISVLFFVALLEGESAGRRWAAWAVASALALATHYFTVVIVGPELVWLLVTFRRDRRARAALAGLAVVGLALLPLALAQRGTGNADYIASSPFGTRALQLVKQFLTGYASPLAAVAATLAALLVLVALIALWRSGDAVRRRRVLVVLALAATGVAITFLLAAAGIDYLNTRNLLPLLAPVVAAVAACFAAARWAVPAGAALAIVLLAVTVAVASDGRYQREDWRGVADALGPPARARAIVITPASGSIPLELYERGLRSYSPAGEAVSEVDLVAVGRRPASGGAAEVPPVPPASPLPPAFRRVAVDRSSTYAVVRYRAAAPTPLPLAAAAPASLVPGDVTVVAQGRG